jgi:hypothetical protein
MNLFGLMAFAASSSTPYVNPFINLSPSGFRPSIHRKFRKKKRAKFQGKKLRYSR